MKYNIIQILKKQNTPLSVSNLTTDMCPSTDASKSGVSPDTFCALMLHPEAISSLLISTYPHSAA